MPEKSFMCTDQKSVKLWHFSLSLTLFLLLLSMHIMKHWEIFRKEREGEMKQPQRSKINDPFIDGTPGKPTYFTFSQGLRLFLEYLVFDDINQ